MCADFTMNRLLPLTVSSKHYTYKSSSFILSFLPLERKLRFWLGVFFPLLILNEFLRFKWASHSNQLNQEKNKNHQRSWNTMKVSGLAGMTGTIQRCFNTSNALWFECSVSNFSHSAERNSSELWQQAHNFNNLCNHLIETNTKQHFQHQYRLTAFQIKSRVFFKFI